MSCGAPSCHTVKLWNFAKASFFFCEGFKVTRFDGGSPNRTHPTWPAAAVWRSRLATGAQYDRLLCRVQLIRARGYYDREGFCALCSVVSSVFVAKGSREASSRNIPSEI